jgi:hypothetical protein
LQELSEHEKTPLQNKSRQKNNNNNNTETREGDFMDAALYNELWEIVLSTLTRHYTPTQNLHNVTVCVAKSSRHHKLPNWTGACRAKSVVNPQPALKSSKRNYYLGNFRGID